MPDKLSMTLSEQINCTNISWLFISCGLYFSAFVLLFDLSPPSVAAVETVMYLTIYFLQSEFKKKKKSYYVQTCLFMQTYFSLKKKKTLMIAFNRNKLNQICSHDLCQRMYNKLYKEPCHVSVYYIVFIIYFLRRFVLKM